MSIRLIAADLDKTLLRSDKILSAFTAETLLRCREAGTRIVIATARTEGYCEEVIRVLQPDAVISNSGALARAGETVLFDRPIPADEADALIADILQRPSFRRLTVQTTLGYYVSQPHGGNHSIVYDFSAPLHRPAYKITPELGDPSDADALRRLHPNCEVVRFTGEDWYRIVAKGCGKWPALQAAAAHFSVDAADIAAFGDDVLDDEMLAGCGFGVAVANASPSTAAAAAYHCETNDEDGVALWLRRRFAPIFA